MSRWDELYRKVRDKENVRIEAVRRHEARAEHDAWAEKALEEMWQALLRTVGSRAEEFRQTTGRSIDYAKEVRVVPGQGELPDVRVIELRLDGSAVDLYSHQASGEAPGLYVAHWLMAPKPRRRHHRMLSLPLGQLEPEGAGWSIRRGDATLGVDDVVYRAFELLALGVPRSRASESAA